jgi:hypothetical protein
MAGQLHKQSDQIDFNKKNKEKLKCNKSIVPGNKPTKHDLCYSRSPKRVEQNIGLQRRLQLVLVQ